MGDAQQALHKTDEARTTLGKALAIARTMEPTAQEVWIPKMQEKLASP